MSLEGTVGPGVYVQETGKVAGVFQTHGQLPELGQP